jgi:hypothetical protein
MGAVKKTDPNSGKPKPKDSTTKEHKGSQRKISKTFVILCDPLWWKILAHVCLRTVQAKNKDFTCKVLKVFGNL